MRCTRKCVRVRKKQFRIIGQTFELLSLFDNTIYPGGVFIVIFVGIGLAIITLIIEYWYYKYKKPIRVDSSSKKMQVKQAIQATSGFNEKRDFETEYR